MSDQMGKTNVKKSKQLVSAGVFIALYFVVFAVIGTVCMPVPPLYLAMTSIIALVGAPVYLMLVAKAPLHGPIFIAAVLPSLFLLLMGNIWIVVLFGALFGIIAEVIAGSGGVQEQGAQCDKLFVLRPEPYRRLSADLGHAGLFLRRHAEPRHEPGVR